MNAILEYLQTKTNYLAIRDDLLIHSTKKAYEDRLEEFLRLIWKKWFNISPKKCQLFRIDLQYVENTVVIEKKKSLC